MTKKEIEIENKDKKMEEQAETPKKKRGRPKTTEQKEINEVDRRSVVSEEDKMIKNIL